MTPGSDGERESDSGSLDRLPDEPLRGYAICTVGRSGTNWANQVLSSTRELGNPSDYFHAIRWQKDPSYPSDPAEQVARVLTAGRTPNNIYGVKVAPFHIDGLVERLKWCDCLPNLKLVRWVRRDILDQAISWHRATVTRQFRSWQAPVQPAAYDGEAILQSIVTIARVNARWDVFFARNGPPALSLVYEDFVGKPQSIADAFADLMGLRSRPRIDPSLIDLEIQRDQTTLDWRDRFLREHSDRNYVDHI